MSANDELSEKLPQIIEMVEDWGRWMKEHGPSPLEHVIFYFGNDDTVHMRWKWVKESYGEDEPE